MTECFRLDYCGFKSVRFYELFYLCRGLIVEILCDGFVAGDADFDLVFANLDRTLYKISLIGGDRDDQSGCLLGGHTDECLARKYHGAVIVESCCGHDLVFRINDEFDRRVYIDCHSRYIVVILCFSAREEQRRA